MEQGHRQRTGAAPGPGYEGGDRAGIEVAGSSGWPRRRAWAARYSRSRPRRPWNVPRLSHLRSRSNTRRTAWRQEGQQYFA
jgi:hypothetical protein